MLNNREVTPRETDQAHEGQSSVREGKRKWSAERDSRIRESSAGIYRPARDTLLSQQSNDLEGDPRRKTRTALEESQEQEKDDTTLVLDNIELGTLKKLCTAIYGMTTGRGKGRGLYPVGHPYHETALSLGRDITKIRRFREGMKDASRDDAYAAMSRLLHEIPRIPTASTNVATFLREVEQIKQSDISPG
jgi:hypothetical protein